MPLAALRWILPTVKASKTSMRSSCFAIMRTPDPNDKVQDDRDYHAASAPLLMEKSRCGLALMPWLMAKPCWPRLERVIDHFCSGLRDTNMPRSTGARIMSYTGRGFQCGPRKGLYGNFSSTRIFFQVPVWLHQPCPGIHGP